MEPKKLPLPRIGRVVLLTQLLLIAGAVDDSAAFVHNGGIGVGSSRVFTPRRVGATHIAYGNEGNAGRPSSSKAGMPPTNAANKWRRKKSKGPTKKIDAPNGEKNIKPKKASRPASFAAIRKELRKDTKTDTNKQKIEEGSGVMQSAVENVIDSATISRISRKRHRERQQEQQARRFAKEERKDLKNKLYELSLAIDRGFQSTSQEANEMKAVIDRLTELNPTTEPAWSYYGKTNPLTRQLYQSLAKPKKGGEDENNLASLEGKWILTYTNVPSIVALANDSNRWGFAKLGRIGQECTPFPDYTVRTIIEWKRPDWVQNLESNLPGPMSRRLFGKAESSVLQKTTLRARATPDDPTSWGVSTVPSVFEVVSSRSSSALYGDDDDDDNTPGSTLSFVTDDGLVALDPLKPLKIGLQIAGMNDEQGLFGDDDNDEKNDGKAHKAGGTSLITKNGLVALNPFQPWTVGLQMAGFARQDQGYSKSGKKANEPWKTDENSMEQNNLFKDINERGLVEGVLKQTPIQFTLGDAADEETEAEQNSGSKTRILYLDDDIRITGDGQDYVTVETRACTDKDEDCWF